MGKMKQAVKPAYAGIGSRETPEDIQDMFAELAEDLEAMGFMLRTGGALGADEAFMSGVIEDDNIELYLPWPGYNDYNSKYEKVNGAAYEMAFIHHPNWNSCSEGARKLHARNSFIILGPDLKTPSEFVLCWTKDGKGSGGTGQGIRIADSHLIQVFDFGVGVDVTMNSLEEYLTKQGYMK